MSMISDLLFTDKKNELYETIAKAYHNYWTSIDNVKKILKTPITTCALCSSYENSVISVLGIYYDSMPYNSVTILDASVVSIMCLLNEEQLNIDNESLLACFDKLNPDVIRNHYFLNICNERERCINDWDVIEILKTLMLNLKTNSTYLRQYANLTKLLKKECLGTCNTFITRKQLNVIEKQQNDSGPSYFISERNKDLAEAKSMKNNTSKRIAIAHQISHING